MGVLFNKEPIRRREDSFVETTVKEKDITVEYKESKNKKVVKPHGKPGSSKAVSLEPKDPYKEEETRENVIKFRERKKSKDKEGVKFKDTRVEREIEYKEPAHSSEHVNEEIIEERIIEYEDDRATADSQCEEFKEAIIDKVNISDDKPKELLGKKLEIKQEPATSNELIIESSKIVDERMTEAAKELMNKLVDTVSNLPTSHSHYKNFERV